MSIIADLTDDNKWQCFLEYKKESGNVSEKELENIERFICEKRYLDYYNLIIEDKFPVDFPVKKTINKMGTKKKRVVYTYKTEENIILKYIVFNLHKYDSVFLDNCYAFRKNYGVKDAINSFKRNKEYDKLYCYKADISNYFNSINVNKLLVMLNFFDNEDNKLFDSLKRILMEKRVYENGHLVEDSHGAMAGTPFSTFLANVYLMDIDKYFFDKGIKYFRYSDDVLLFADSMEELNEYISIFNVMIADKDLSINKDKENIYNPQSGFEFLGFSYRDGNIDISSVTLTKMKSKIKRKAEALRRWQRNKGLSEDKAAKGFINAMNNKFYGRRDKMENDDDNDERNELTWSRWYFPNINVDDSLKELDKYMQEYIRYIITGRHYKGNYRITYEQLKKWGYRSLVNEYYKSKKARMFK